MEDFKTLRERLSKTKYSPEFVADMDNKIYFRISVYADQTFYNLPSIERKDFTIKRLKFDLENTIKNRRESIGKDDPINEDYMEIVGILYQIQREKRLGKLLDD